MKRIKLMEIDRKTYGRIFDIQGHSVHDGPGSRTLVFLKGCPLRCKWCSNPEGQNTFAEPMYHKDRCIHDGLCMKECYAKAITSKKDEIIIDRAKCASCAYHECVKACCSSGLRIAGYEMSVDELFDKIQRDRAFWGNEGGVTLTGGEPLSQADFVVELLKKCFDAYIHTAVETCGHVKIDTIKRVMGLIDWIFFDIKSLNEEKHLLGTGVSGKAILDNARLIASEFKGRLIFRMVIIPAYNDSDDEIEAVANFINSLPVKKKEINILPLHHMGREKYTMLGRDYFFKEIAVINDERLLQIKKIFDKNNIECYIGADTPF